MTLLIFYILMPFVLAAPLVVVAPEIGIGGGYFEMLSCLTTTGATLFDKPHLLPERPHLWRSLIGWCGGLLVLIFGFAILAPMNLGGFQLTQVGDGGAPPRAAARSRKPTAGSCAACAASARSTPG